MIHSKYSLHDANYGDWGFLCRITNIIDRVSFMIHSFDFFVIFIRSPLITIFLYHHNNTSLNNISIKEYVFYAKNKRLCFHNPSSLDLFSIFLWKKVSCVLSQWTSKRNIFFYCCYSNQPNDWEYDPASYFYSFQNISY